MPAYAAPVAFASTDHVLEIARQVVDGDVARLMASPDHLVSCAAGCSACCNQAVPVSAAEVRAIRSFIESLPDERRRELEKRIREAADRLRHAGISTDVPPAGDRDRADYVERYFEAGVPCPLLDDDGTCGVRPIRPLACREYLVTSDPVHCARLGHPQTVRLSNKRDAIAGFRASSAAFGESEVGVLALDLAGPQTRSTGGPLSGPKLMQLLTSTYRQEREPT